MGHRLLFVLNRDLIVSLSVMLNSTPIRNYFVACQYRLVQTPAKHIAIVLQAEELHIRTKLVSAQAPITCRVQSSLA